MHFVSPLKIYETKKKKYKPSDLNENPRHDAIFDLFI